MEKKIKTHGMRKLLDFVAVAIAVTAIFWACTGTRVKYDPTHGVPPCEITEDFDKLFTNLFPNEGPGGIVTVMLRDTIVYNHAFGLATLGGSTPDYITDSTLFNISSSSKIFTSVALLKMAEKGLINFDDKISSYFPEFSSNLLKDITIRHILMHSSGLPDLRPRDRSQWDHYLRSHKSTFASGSDYRCYGREDEHMQIFQNLDTVDYAPGTHYQRNDPAFILIAPLVERVTGTSFDAWMRENVFKPAGMKDACYFNPGTDMPRMAHGYRKAEGPANPGVFRSADGKWDEYDYGEADFFLTKADRGAYCSTRDFMNWFRALYGGKLLSDSSFRALHTPYMHTDIPMVSFGLACGLRSVPGLPLKVYHMNRNGGFEAMEGTWPERKLHVVVFANRADWNERAVANSVDSIFHVHGWI